MPTKLNLHQPKQCPHCNGYNTRKQGFNNDGQQRYYCKTCEKTFSEEPEECWLCGKTRKVKPFTIYPNENETVPLCQLCRESTKRRTLLLSKGVMK